MFAPYRITDNVNFIKLSNFSLANYTVNGSIHNISGNNEGFPVLYKNLTGFSIKTV